MDHSFCTSNLVVWFHLLCYSHWENLILVFLYTSADVTLLSVLEFQCQYAWSKCVQYFCHGRQSSVWLFYFWETLDWLSYWTVWTVWRWWEWRMLANIWSDVSSHIICSALITNFRTNFAQKKTVFSFYIINGRFVCACASSLKTWFLLLFQYKQLPLYPC